MIPKNILRNLADYVLLNSCAVKSTGLYNGKAGLSLCLFEISKVLNDDYLEDQAFDLLQESLLSKNNDIGFEDGLSGIGYVLLYLIENKFIDANFNLMYEKQLNKILKTIKESIGNQKKLMNLSNTIYFLAKINRSKNSIIIEKYINLIIKNIEKHLLKALSDLNSLDSNFSKKEVLKTFEKYLKLIQITGKPNSHILKLYSDLYNKNKISSDFILGYYLNKISSTNHLDNLMNIAQKNIEFGIQNMYIKTISLAEQIEYIYLLNSLESKATQKLELENDLAFNSEEYFEKHIIKKIPQSEFIAGFENGIARLLLFSVYNQDSNKSRFNSLFI